VERTAGIRLRPEPDHTGVLECIIPHVEPLPAVAVAGDLVALHPYAEDEPLARRRLEVDGPEHRAFAVDNLVDPVVVLDRIDPADVVVVLVLASPDQPTALVVFTRVASDPHAQVQVLVRRLLQEG